MPSLKLTRDHFRAAPFGKEFIREFDLVIADNVIASLKTQRPLYDDELADRVADFCLPHDQGYIPNHLGIISLSPIDDMSTHQVLDHHLGNLRLKPRGTWATFERLGHFDSWMSNGIGGVVTRSGAKFLMPRPDHPSIDVVSLAAQLYSMAIYKHRSKITADIIKHSLEANEIFPGGKFKKVRIDGHIWSNMTYIGRVPGASVGSCVDHRVAVSRRGVSKAFRITDESFFRIMGIEPLMPACYKNEKYRLYSLAEAREQAAQALWAEIGAGYDTLGSKAPFTRNGDIYHRNAYKESDGFGSPPTHLLTVQFAPDDALIISRSITPVAELPIAA